MIRPQSQTALAGLLKEPDLTIVVPTRNERENIQKLIHTIRKALTGLSIEILIIDDSDDETFEIIEEEMQSTFTTAWRMGAVHRATPQEREGGLATAVVMGLRRAQAKYVAVIDADLQHPPEQLRDLYDAAIATQADIVVATRYRAGGSYEGLDGFSRRFISIGLKTFSQLVFPDQIRRISDPLGGFFLVRRAILEDIDLRPIGYKISLEVMVRSAWVRLTEVPYQFRAREGGQSKSNTQQGLMVLRHMLRLFHEVPGAGFFWKYGIAGCFGLIAYLIASQCIAHLGLTDVRLYLIALIPSVFVTTIICTVWFSRQLRSLPFMQQLFLPLSQGIGLVTIGTIVFLLLTRLLSFQLSLTGMVSFLGAMVMYYLPTGYLHFKAIRQHTVKVVGRVRFSHQPLVTQNG